MDTDVKIQKAHTKIIRAFISKVLASTMTKYVHPGICYPAIVGGLNLDRCADMTPTTRELISKIMISDIDIKFVVTKQLKDVQDGGIIDFVDQQRRLFIKGCFEHKAVRGILRSCTLGTGLKVSFEMKSKYAEPRPKDEVIKDKLAQLYLLRIFSIDIIYSDAQTGIVKRKLGFMDTGIFSNVTTPKYKDYPSVFQPGTYKSPEVMPIVLKRGVVYATCGWTYIDTVKMLHTYASLVSDKAMISQANDRTFAINAFIKYLTKYIVMYIMINHTSEDTQQMRLLKRTLERTRGLRKKILSNITNNTLIMDDRYLKYVWFFKKILDKHTNLKDLRAAFVNGDLETFRDLNKKRKK